METIQAVIDVHAISATVVLLLGPAVLLRRSRDRAHRMLGRTWVVTILVVCASSFGIRPEGFSWLHALSVWTLVSVALGVAAIRRRRVAVHRTHMVGCYLGTVAAFAFAAVVPERLIPTMLREQPVILAATALAVAVTVALWTWAVTRQSTSVRAPVATS